MYEGATVYKGTRIHLPIWSCSCKTGIPIIAAIIWTRGL